MFGDQERVTARELMTSDPETVPAGATTADVAEWFEERGYTAAPLDRTDPPYLYCTRDAVTAAAEDSPDDRVYEHAERVALDTLVSPDLEFAALLDELAAEPLYFIGWHGTVEGIVTRADLNRPAAHAYLYTRIGELEMRLRDLVDAVGDWEGTLAALPREGRGEETEYDAVLAEYESYADADLQLRPVDYTTFWQLQQAVVGSEAAVDVLPFESGEDAETALHDLRELRNQVAHYGNVVHNVDREMLSDGRNVHEFASLYATLEACLDALRECDDGSTDRPVGPAE